MSEHLERIITDEQATAFLEKEGEQTRAGEDRFTFKDLPEELRTIYDDNPGTFNTQVAEFINSQVREISAKADADLRHYPFFPESEAYKNEIEAPHFRTDPETGITYAMYLLNRDKGLTPEGRMEKPPLIMELQWAAGAETRAGRRTLRALCEAVDQPIIVQDMVGSEREKPQYLLTLG